MRRDLPGFNLTELLVVMVITAVVGMAGVLAYEERLETIRHDTFDRVKGSVEELLQREYTRIIEGRAPTLIDPNTNQYITNDSTCSAFLQALRPMLSKFKNPYDKSSAVTFSSAGSLSHKRGKVRITCYKLLHHGNINGADCPLSRAAIRITKFNVPCGAACHYPLCPASRKACLGLYPYTWYAGMQKETFIGKLVTSKIHMPPHYMPDIVTARAECRPGVFRASGLPLEPDY